MENCKLHQGAYGVWELHLTRAPVNALTADMLGDIAACLARAEADSACRALVLSASGKVFSAGMDLRAALSFGADEEIAMSRAFTDTYTALYRFSKPMVAAVQGAAIAGGFFLAVAADLRVATASATFSIAEVQVGARLPVGALEIARAELSPACFRRMLLSGDPIDAHTALANGIVDEIVTEDDLLLTANTRAGMLVDLPPAAYAATKADLRAPALERIEAAIAAGAHAPDTRWFLPGTKEAIARRLA